MRSWITGYNRLMIQPIRQLRNLDMQISASRMRTTTDLLSFMNEFTLTYLQLLRRGQRPIRVAISWFPATAANRILSFKMATLSRSLRSTNRSFSIILENFQQFPSSFIIISLQPIQLENLILYALSNHLFLRGFQLTTTTCFTHIWSINFQYFTQYFSCSFQRTTLRSHHGHRATLSTQSTATTPSSDAT